MPPIVTWSPVFLDVDLDGYEDLLITTGIEPQPCSMPTPGAASTS